MPGEKESIESQKERAYMRASKKSLYEIVSGEAITTLVLGFIIMLMGCLACEVMSKLI
jgi:hypothetical protein